MCWDLERCRNRNAIKSSFAVIISYANSTFLTQQTSISWSTLFFLVVEKIWNSLFVEQQRMHPTTHQILSPISWRQSDRVWVYELQVNQLLDAPFSRLDECTDGCCNCRRALTFLSWGGKWIDAESIYSTLMDWLKKRNGQCRKLVGMGFDGTATFAGKKSRVLARLKKNAPPAIFVHCHFHTSADKLQIVIRWSSMSTLHSPLCGSSSIAPQRHVSLKAV